MKEDLISIIIPIYNSMSYLEYNLKSILEQNYNQYEVLMIDDGSTDKSAEICKKIAKKDNRFKYFYKSNSGVSASRNLGIQKAKGKYILFVDSDDLLEENILSKINKKLTSEFQILRFNYKKIYNHKKIQTLATIKKEIKESQKDFIKYILLSGDGFLWDKVYIRKIIIENKIRFNEKISICEDLLFNIQYAKYIKQSIALPDTGYGYFQSKDSSYNKSENLNWFTIFQAYDKIEKELIKIDKKLYIYSLYEHIYANCEAIARNNENIIKYVNIKEIKKFTNRNILIVLTSREICLKLKIKLILFKLFPNIVYKYKRKRLEKKYANNNN